MPEWDAEFAEVLHEVIEPQYHHLLSPAVELASLGVDSMAAVQLLTLLEDSYAVMFPPESLVGATFATPELLWAAVTRLRASG